MSAAREYADLYSQLDALPENQTGEIIAGELHATPRPGRVHARAATRLAARVGGAFDDPAEGGPGGWLILMEPELHLGSDVLVPDLAGWRTGRLDPDGKESHFTVAPDWVCEIASPTTWRRDRTLKRDADARAGVAWLWLVEPDAALLEAYRLHEGQWVLLGTWAGATEARIPPFDAIDLRLSGLWTANPSG